MCTATGVPGPCGDDPRFQDRQGLKCEDWGPAQEYPCEDAGAQGYSDKEVAVLLKACRKACRIAEAAKPARGRPTTSTWAGRAAT